MTSSFHLSWSWSPAHEGTSPGVTSLLSRDYVHLVGPYELCTSWKTFVPMALCCKDTGLLLWFLSNPCGPLRSRKNSISNFGLKLCTHKGLSENSLWWNFQHFWLFLSWEITHSLYRRANISIFIIQERNNQKCWNFHHKLFSLQPLSVQSFKPKFKIEIFGDLRGTTGIW